MNTKIYIYILKGWNYNVADTLPRTIRPEKHNDGRVWAKLQ